MNTCGDRPRTPPGNQGRRETCGAYSIETLTEPPHPCRALTCYAVCRLGQEERGEDEADELLAALKKLGISA